MSNNISLKIELPLISVAFFWGSTYIVSRELLEHITVWNYMFIRFSIAFLLIFIFSIKYLKDFNSRLIKRGVILGSIMFAYYFLQTRALTLTSATNTAFITGLYIIFIPLFSFLFFKEKFKTIVIPGIFLCIYGLYYLTGGDILKINTGDMLVFGSAILIALHILLTGKFVSQLNIINLTAIEFLTIGLLSLIFSSTTGEVKLPMTFPIVSGLLYLSIFCTVYTFFVQNYCQQFATSTHVGLIFALEPIFGAITAYGYGNEKIGEKTIFGAMLIIAGVIISEINWKEIYVKK